jgi:hypothetical protein
MLIRCAMSVTLVRNHVVWQRNHLSSSYAYPTKLGRYNMIIFLPGRGTIYIYYHKIISESVYFTGERLGLMQSLAGLAAILSKFTVMPSENTKRNPPVDPLSGLVQTLKGGVPVLLKARKKDN